MRLSAGVAVCLCFSWVLTLAGCGGGIAATAPPPLQRHASYYYGASCQQDRSPRRDRDFLCGRDRQQSFDLPVAEGPGSDFGRDLGQLHHASCIDDRRWRPVPGGGEQWGRQCHQQSGNPECEQHTTPAAAERG